ncbi:MAG: DUF5694 domain-containing protein [Fimbriimonadaceae bacterium]
MNFLPLALTLTGLSLPADQAQVLILGTFHFHNPTHDLFNPSMKDPLSERRQTEIAAVVDALAAFKPTAVAIEAEPSVMAFNDRLTQLYADEYTLGPDERDQIGLRLARRLGLRQVHGIDFKQDMDFGRIVAWAAKNGRPNFMQEIKERIQKEIEPVLGSDAIESRSLAATLRLQNDPATLHRSDQLYLELAQMSSPDDWAGADVVGDWHKRNLKIAVNIARLAKPGERVFVIIGAGHVPNVAQYLRSMPGVRVVDTLAYLPQE